MLFRTAADARHGLDRFDRVFASGAFRRQHHRVGVVEYRVGYIGHFGTGRHRAVNHRLHHLGRGDHHLVVTARVQNDLFLDTHQLGIADFHAEVAARHHYTVAGADQAVQRLVIGHGFGSFDLGDQPGAGAGFVAQAARQVHVGGIAREGNRQVVQLEVGGQFDVGLVLGGQRRRGQTAATTVDPLVVRQRAADQHGAVQFIGRGVVHAHHHAPVVQQQFVTDAAILDQVRVVDADHFLGAGVARVGDGEAELVAFLQLDAFVGELGDADLRALQVAQQCDKAAMTGGDLADQFGPGTVLVGAAV